MGWQAITDAYAASRSLHLRLAESSLLVALAFHKNDQTGLCFPSFDSLIEETGMNLRTLRGSLKKLVELGLVSYSRERIGAPTRYSLRLPTVQKCTVQKDTVQIYTVQKGTSQGADLPPDTVQKCTPNREVNKEPKQEEGSAAIPRAHASRAASLPCPSGIEPDAWEASNRIRRSKRVGAWTERAWSLAVKAGEQKGLSPSEMLDYCISRGWASFRAEYYDERKATSGDPYANETPEEHEARIKRIMQMAYGEQS